ncbi:hypothetical protein AURDEDRAFT_124409 [Auricularia subglabra TFB-10046 SS5]|nr:hypothetical protein AURDEDRAFT_124409 [Auricularia subglabra TFB-10046 SS5]
MSSPTAYEFALSPLASDFDDDDASEPGTAYTFSFPSPHLPGSPLYLEERTHHHANLERENQRATVVEQQFGMNYPCDFGDCTDVLPSARALACHLHIHYISMELPEERGLNLPSFYSGNGLTDADDFTLDDKSPTAAQRAANVARAMMAFALKLWAVLVWFFWR